MNKSGGICESNEPDIIKGKSYLKRPIETDIDIIKDNKLTILNHICSPRKIQETIPQMDSKQNSQINKSSTYISTACVHQ